MSYTTHIYKITNSVNCQVFVGSTKQKLGVRLSAHKRASKKDNPTKPVDQCIKELGIENFHIELLIDKEVNGKKEENALVKEWVLKIINGVPDVVIDIPELVDHDEKNYTAPSHNMTIILPPDADENSPNKFFCGQCSTGFTRKSSLTRHVRKKHLLPSYDEAELY